MSTSVLGSTPQYPWWETLVEDTLQSGLTRGFLARRSRNSEDYFEGKYVFDFSSTSASHSGFVDFFRARRGAADSFLWKARTYYYSHADAEALGTGDAATTQFTLDMKHIDSANLTVYLDGASQGAGWTLLSNNTSPQIVFATDPAAGTDVTASYEYYYPVIYQDRITVRPKTNDSTSGQILVTPPLMFRQDSPGSHKA